MPTFPAQYESLAEISDIVVRAARRAGLDEAAVYAVQTAVDEASANIIEHAYGRSAQHSQAESTSLSARTSPGDKECLSDPTCTIECSCTNNANTFSITLKDHGQPFNPNNIPTPDVHAELENRPIGGLGLYFIRQLMDDVRFEFQPPTQDQPGTNILTLIKNKKSESQPINTESVYAALQRRSEQLVSVAEVSHAISSILDFDLLLKEVVKLIQRRLGYPYVQIFTVHPGRRKIFYEAGSIPDDQQLHLKGFAYNLDDTHGIIPWVARSGQTLVANDVSREPRYRFSEGIPAIKIRSELTVALIFGQDVLGILDIQSDRRNAFDEDDRTLFEALAASISVAMRNANLYHAEQWRHQVADGLREVAGLLSADADLQQVLDAILAELERNLPCEAAAIWLLEQPDSSDETPTHRLELAAVHAPGGDLNLEYSHQSPGAWLEEALQAAQPITRAAGAPYEPIGQQLNYPPDYSAIAAPMRIGNRLLGVLVLAHSNPNRYGSEARSVTASFASYAAVAIENTRLYEASHEQAWAATVLLQVAEATQSFTDPHDLLSTVAHITPSLVGVSACALWLWDTSDETFWPVGASGLPTEQELEFQVARFAPGEQACFDQIIADGKLVVAHSDDLKLLNSTADCTKVLYPLVAHSGVLGAMLVNFNAQADGISNEKLGIIQGIAHQTATAVENIRLFRSQREEAYVSVALLQVAQAVVSNNDLGEILEAIVRITPMLVGVRRAAIFLWDESHAAFRLSHSYGIPREIEESLQAAVFPGGAFPLLDTARLGDALSYAIVEDPAESPELWSQLEPFLPEKPATGFSKELLRHNGCLLLAFPLSVKGLVLGVMVVEESEALGGASSSIRERRLEIVTGISQQAAMAIQNDLLQQEVVERGRLERELQLAREIQRTFLPDKLPQRPGIDLDVRWRPARQVGGDFYDIIEFADGRLGLVIADVADKGMPAALIMTLMRTLIRATAWEEPSPAAVLERVNNLLVPDARNGMFVTVAYAVLSADGRELVYANAGHNLPLLVRNDGSTTRVEALNRCGMALGISEDIHIAEQRSRLSPGDLLILYTDGVTEAFSPNGEMYGEEYLHTVVCAADSSSACAMLDAIDRSVDQFTGEEVPSDDLTLVVLKLLA